ncbi:MAG TPA: ATP-binding cassette domain-containing protein [Propionibacterium sp.]|nr:ATP-binding cassette domain-containing protein [Propionibacterium sp.]
MIHLDDVHYAYPDGRSALDGVSLRIAAGERVAILGPNGAGKTTLALHLNGLLTPRAGSVSIAGTPINRRSLAAVRRRVGMLFQDPDDQLFSSTVADDVAFGPFNAGVRGDELDHRVAAALMSVGAHDLVDRAPHHLSYGQKQRVALAGILVLEPDVIVLDEPTSMLDPAARRDLVDLLGRLDTTLVVITHDLPLALQACDRVIVLDAGRIVADGPPREVFADDDLLARHRLELPWGFDRGLLRR